MNIFLIPRYGMTAGACVSVSTYFLSDFVIYGVFRETRFIFRIGVSALASLIRSPVLSFRETLELFSHKV